MKELTIDDHPITVCTAWEALWCRLAWAWVCLTSLRYDRRKHGSDRRMASRRKHGAIQQF
jgi:hypothetical protein